MRALRWLTAALIAVPVMLASGRLGRRFRLLGYVPDGLCRSQDLVVLGRSPDNWDAPCVPVDGVPDPVRAGAPADHGVGR